MVHSLVIIGSGPAGLTAGIYAARAKLSPVIIEGPLPGGQLMTTTTVENWPGEKSILGPDLMINMRSQAEACGCAFVGGQVTAVDFSGKPLSLTLDNGKTVQAHSVIIATGSTSRKLGCAGEATYWGKGVSVCATCDAPFYAGKDVIVVGGGNTAVTEVEHLSHVAKTVTVIHILDALTATDPLKHKILNNPKVTFLYNTTVTEITGDGQKVTGVVVENKKDGSKTTLQINGIFVAIGSTPNTALFKGQLAIGQYGFLEIANHTRTSVEGVFAAGDVSDYRYRQAITSSGVGCMAALDAQAYLAVKSS